MITLVLGGARSGKSAFAEQLAAATAAPVTYIATATVGDDADFAARVQHHRDRRPPEWSTAEPGAGLVPFLASGSLAEGHTLLIDSLGTWVASQPEFVADGAGLRAALLSHRGHCIVVSEEVGLGVHPSTEIGGRFRDALGTVNQAIAEVAAEAYLVVAGRPLRLGSSPGTPA